MVYFMIWKRNKRYLSDGERIYISCGDQDQIEAHVDHVDRYKFALDYIRPEDKCLDAACGCGYGSELMSNKAIEVIALDINDHALKFANENYTSSRIVFWKADLNKPLNLPDGCFNVVISFETIEHISNQDMLLAEFSRVLKPGGLIIISTPDRAVSIKAGHKNKFHIVELTKSEFLELISKYFKVDEVYGQIKYKPLSWSKRLITFVIKVDLFKFRYKVISKLRLKNINKAFSCIDLSAIEKIGCEDENNYFIIIAVARKV